MQDFSRWAGAVLFAAFFSCVVSPIAAAERAAASWSVYHHAESIAAATPARLLPLVDLVLDDGGREADVGFNAATAFQFLWLNRFPAPTLPGQAFDLEEIQVLFPPGPGMAAGAAVQLVVWTDTDGDPSTGATLLGAFDDVIQSVDGTTFSIYTVDPPLRVQPGSSDVLVGVVNRFVQSGVSAASRPAALDTTASAGRSWVALWIGDPPDPPSLPGDSVTTTIDTITPGNWMIRASGSLVAMAEIPTLEPTSLFTLAVLLALTAVTVFRRATG